MEDPSDIKAIVGAPWDYIDNLSRTDRFKFAFYKRFAERMQTIGTFDKGEKKLNSLTKISKISSEKRQTERKVLEKKVNKRAEKLQQI